MVKRNLMNTLEVINNYFKVMQFCMLGGIILRELIGQGHRSEKNILG